MPQAHLFEMQHVPSPFTHPFTASQSPKFVASPSYINPFFDQTLSPNIFILQHVDYTSFSLPDS